MLLILAQFLPDGETFIEYKVSIDLTISLK